MSCAGHPNRQQFNRQSAGIDVRVVRRRGSNLVETVPEIHIVQDGKDTMA